MKNNFRKIILWTFVFIWMLVIFIFSNMNHIESNEKSIGTINYLIENTSKEEKNNEEKQLLIYYLNYPIRKIAHIFIYFVLTCLTLLALKYTLNCKKIYLKTFIICLIYAITDEYHQTFIDGRTGQVIDVFIDLIGVISFLLFYSKYSNYKKKHTQKKRYN